MNERHAISGKSDHLLQTLLDNVSDLIFFTDRDSRLSRLNTAFVDFVGLSDPDDAIGKAVNEFFPMVDMPTYRGEARDLPSTAVPRADRPELRLGADGQTRWLQTTRVPLYDANGGITGLLGIARDVTDVTRINTDLRHREERHRGLLAEVRRQAQELALFDAVRTALARELDLQALFQTVVEAIAQTFGYTLVSLYMLQEDDLVLQHQVGYNRVERRLPVKEGISGRVVRTGKPILLEDVRTDPAFIGAIPGIVSEVCVPLHDAGQVVGTLNVESRDEVRLTDADLQVMVALSEHINVAIGRARLYTEVRQSEARFDSLIRNALDLISILDADGTIRYESPAVQRTLGYQSDELVGRSAFQLVHPEDSPPVQDAFAAALNDPAYTPTLEFRFRHRDGSWRWLEATGTNLLADPAVGGFVVNSRDVTGRRESAARLWHQAHHDPLTGLPNRGLFLDRLTKVLTKSEPASVAVLFLDLDGFKVVNDSLGHDEGDRLLVEVAERLTSALGAGEVLARFGEDEFTILLERETAAGDALLLAERLQRVVTEPFAVHGHTLMVTTSVGIALSSDELATSTDLVRAADVALYRAKARAKGGRAVFDPRRDGSALVRLDRETALREAMERGQLRLHYQPEVDLRTGQLVGVEALVRWQHPYGELLPPDAFIRLAEETGLIVPLGVWVLEEACRQVMVWSEQFAAIGLLRLCVNVSPLQVRNPDLVGQVADTLRKTGYPPDHLTLEITERGLIEDTLASDETVAALKELGVHLAIDDFGSYQAGLGYLRRWPMDMIKLDRTLVADLDRDVRSRAVVTAVVVLAQTLGMEVIGEGIETVEQLALLRGLGCTWGQGHFFAPAMPAEELVVLLEQGTSFLS